MNDLHEIVDISAVNRIFGWVAILLPISAVLIGYFTAVNGKSRMLSALRWLMWGLLGPFNWLMWRLYNALSDRNGLDSVSNVVVNFVIFVVVGCLLGVVFASFERKSKTEAAISQPSVNINS